MGSDHLRDEIPPVLERKIRFAPKKSVLCLEKFPQQLESAFKKIIFWLRSVIVDSG
jgi:hypothetical protein